MADTPASEMPDSMQIGYKIGRVGKDSPKGFNNFVWINVMPELP
jgi:hypothetical protein